MKALITGGGGFLGGAIVRMLHVRGDEVIALGRGIYADLERMGVRCIRADIRNAGAVSQAVRGMDVVFHAAALAAVWGRADEFDSINVGGTRNVVSACFDAGVSRLVYTSTPSVVFGKDHLSGVDESQPYPKRFLSDYARTKAAAEQLVLAANGPALSTVAIRPHLIFGPGDPHLIPRVIERARSGRLRRVGDGQNRVDLTYIDNAAEAHVLAVDALRPGAACAGRAYFISQGEPVILWDWLNALLARIDVPPINRTISFRAAYAAGAAMEFLYSATRRTDEPPMTRFVALQLAKDHFFDISAARRDLAFSPRISTEEAVNRLVASLAPGAGRASGGVSPAAATGDSGLRAM